MGITHEEFVRRYPRLYHMAQVGSWPSIERNGLLSTSALLDLFQIKGEARKRRLRVGIARNPSDRTSSLWTRHDSRSDSHE